MNALPRPGLVGQDQQIPLITGQTRRYVNLDYAASTPALLDVAQAIEALLPWYSSVHRGTGFKSQISTAAYEGARTAVRTFLHARDHDAVVFTRNTTDAINLLACSLPEETQVLAFASEHHANLLPWRRAGLRITHLPVPESPGTALSLLESALQRSSRGPRLVAVAGASNVTGEIWPLQQLTAIAHRYDARLLIDAAQLAPHFPIDLRALDADYIALSGHKLYAPYGAGALVGRADWLRTAPPYLYGGGAVEFVTLDDVLWAPPPDRQEAGSPNVLGAVALGVACQTLRRYGMQRLAEEELELATYLRHTLARVPGLASYALWPEGAAPRLGILSFNLEGFWHSQVAAILSAEYGVGVRHGCFCAHPLLVQLLRVDASNVERLHQEIEQGRKDRIPGAVRVSLGLGTTRDDIDTVAEALEQITRHGPAWHYRILEDSGDCVPDPETRVWPALPLPLQSVVAHGGEAS
jgi:selenocysteine lyase/cysteine desulfurase